MYCSARAAESSRCRVLELILGAISVQHTEQYPLLHVGEGFIPQTTIEKVTFEISARVTQGDFVNDR